MALSGSFPISIAQINTELYRSAGAAFSMQGSLERLLAGVSAGAISLSDSLGKMATVIVATAGPSAFGSSHSFAGVNFGANYSGRTLLLYIFGVTKGAGVATPATVSVSNITAAGVAANTTPVNFYYFTGSDPSTIFSGVQSTFFLNVSATSGTVAFNTSQSMQCSIVVLSSPGINPALGGHSNGNFSNASPLSAVVVATADAVNVAAAAQNSAATLTLTGATKQLQFSHVAGYQCVIGFDTHVAGNGGKTFTVTGAAGATGLIADDWAPA